MVGARRGEIVPEMMCSAPASRGVERALRRVALYEMAKRAVAGNRLARAEGRLA